MISVSTRQNAHVKTIEGFFSFFYSLGYIRNGNLLFISIFISGFKLGRCHLFSLGQLYNRGMYIQIFIEAFRTFFFCLFLSVIRVKTALRERLNLISGVHTT